MFFDDPTPLRSKTQLAVPPSFPDTGWLPPREYPRLDQCYALGIDTETKELDIDHGPGWSRGKSHIIGASITGYWRDGQSKSWYFPIRHEVEPEYNLPLEPTLRFLADAMALPCPKFGANLIFDTGTYADAHIQINGELHDCQFSEALIDESGLVALDYLGNKYLDAGKQTSVLYEWAAKAYGGNATGKQRDNLWRCSPRLVGPYAEEDSRMPLAILKRQWPVMQSEGLLDVYRLECDLIPLWVRMRQQGVRINVAKAEEMYAHIGPMIVDLYKRLKELTGVNAESTTGGDIKKIFATFPELKPPLTENGNPSFNKEWLTSLDHPVADLILEIRKLETVHGTFLGAYLLGSNVKGIVHGEFHPLKGDEGGTRVGRCSSSNPNLQNIPVRTDLGKEIRKAFIPFEGHLCWEKMDGSQLQYRGLAHYAVGPGSDELRAAYINDPNVDYHARVQQLVKSITGKDVERRPIKNVSFGKMFGAGKGKIKRMLNVPAKEADAIYEAYERAAPYTKETMEAMSLEAQTQGYVRSVLGRRFRFNLWEPKAIDYEHRADPLPYQQALRQYGSQIKRAMTHAAISGKLQGIEADIIKKGMWRALKEGVYDVTGVPVLTVHDENDHSVIDDSPIRRDAHSYLKHIMETTIQIRVPIKFDVGRGTSWGDIKE